MTPTLQCCHGTYVRDARGLWRYPWGDEVPGAGDLTLGLARRLGLSEVAVDAPSSDGEGLAVASLRSGPEGPPVAIDGQQDPALVIGMIAPELMAGLMVTVADIGRIAGVTKATIDSYRYRGYLPEPQIVRSRTPLWARPIIRHWLETRPGSGWRTDVYGERGSAVRRMPLTGRRELSTRP